MTDTQTLGDITDALEALDDQLTESMGELTPEIKALLDDLICQDAEKVGRIGHMLKAWKVNEEAARELYRQTREKADQLARKQETLKTYVLEQMHRRGVKKLQGRPWDLCEQKNSQDSVTVHASFEANANLLPEALQRVTREPSKSAILASHKDGEDMSEYATVKRGTHLRVR